ncbi:hypothetical protein [Pseudomonas baltica]|uniref:hypothetical protein n=1 Tax=Pseudomonas baltica TaxID=2762576 RepID=UPI00289F34D2|nr:hypothetical protein [Pseudomonas baltica]
MAMVIGLTHVWRYRWMYWLSSSSTVIGVLAMFIATESELSLIALSFLYLFVQA